MRKIYIIAFAAFSFLFFSISLFGKGINSDMEEQTRSDVPEQIEVEEVSYIDTVSVSADLAVNYEDWKKLIADAELIVVGKVSDVKGVLNTEGLICSEMTMEEPLVLKGEKVKAVNILTTGGVISARMFYEFHSDVLRAKLTSEEYESQIKAFNDSDMVVCNYMNVDNPKEGDEYLLFLTFDEDISRYRITGTSFFGEFVSSSDGEEFIRYMNGAESCRISLHELEKGIDTIPDNSANIREQRKNMVQAEKDTTIEERDPAYDVFKGTAN